MTENIEEFNKYLTSLFVKVQELRNRSEEINNAQAKYQKKYSKFLLNVLSSYE
jgi:predicted metal-binding protein